MRDISGRIRRYRLARYALPEHPLRRRIRWVWFGLAAWGLWVGLLSDHSFYRLWRLGQENTRTAAELARVRRETEKLDQQISDPRAQRDLAERELREKSGMAQPGEIVYRIRPGTDSLGSR